MTFAPRPEAHRSIESVQHGRDAGRSQPLIAEGQFAPAQESAGRDDHVHSLPAETYLPSPAEQASYLIGDVHHAFADDLGQGRELRCEQSLLVVRSRILSLQDGEPVHEGLVQLVRTSEAPSIVTASRRVGCGYEAKGRRWRDQLVGLLDEERLFVEESVQQDEYCRVGGVYLIQDEHAASLHGRHQRAVHEAHVSVLEREMPDEIADFEAFRAGGLPDRVVEPRRDLPNQRAFARARIPEDVEWVGLVLQEEDHEVLGEFPEDEAVVHSRGVVGRFFETANLGTRGLAGKDFTGIEEMFFYHVSSKK